MGLLIDQPFFTVRDEAAVNDLVYVNKCLRDHLTKDYLGVGFVQGGLLAVKVKGQALGSVWFCAYDDARDVDPSQAAKPTAWSGCCCPPGTTSTSSSPDSREIPRSWRRWRI